MKTSNPYALKRPLAVLLLLLATAILPTAAAAAPPQNGPFTYVVQRGDTLFSISRHFGTTVADLMAANGLSGSLIYAGQRLLIPCYEPPPIIRPITDFDCKYRVVEHESFYPLAYRYRTDPDDLMRANYLYSPHIFAGEELRVPCLNPVPPPLPSYTVRPGDDLFRLSVKYNTTVQAFALVNGLAIPSLIFPGLTLVIPEPQAFEIKPIAPIAPIVVPPIIVPPVAVPVPIVPVPVVVPSSGFCEGACSIVIQRLAFQPPILTIARGSTVVWLNLDPMGHTLISGTPGIPSNVFASPTFGTNASWAFTFTLPGAYPYYDEIQGGNMVGVIIVR